MADVGRHKKRCIRNRNESELENWKQKKIQLGDITMYRKDKTTMLGSTCTKILKSPAIKMKRLFNCMPAHRRDITRYTIEYSKKILDEWLREEVPDQPKCRIYA